MTTEREMLEFAAKACGLSIIGFANDNLAIRSDGCVSGYVWNPLTNSADCAEMCAKLEIHTQWWNHSVACISNSGNDKRDVKHDGTDAGKEAAWRYAATIVAAKIGGMK